MPRLFLGGSTITWGPRRTSRVRIKARITDVAAGALDLDLDLPRQCFRTDASVRGVLARLLTILVNETVTRRRAARVPVSAKCQLRLTGRPWARLRVSSAGFNALRRHRQEDARSLRRIRAMAVIWFHQCIGERVVDLIRTPPRGGGPTRRLLMTHLPHAFLAAHHLVEVARLSNEETSARAIRLFTEASQDESRRRYIAFVEQVSRRMDRVLSEHSIYDYVTAHHSRAGDTAARHALIVALIHRAFQGAWERAGYAGLLAQKRPPVEWLRKYLYGRHHRRASEFLRWLRQVHPADYFLQLLAWGRDFLSEPGRAARSLGLADRPASSSRA
jgi:hypothetical protein